MRMPEIESFVIIINMFIALETYNAANKKKPKLVNFKFFFKPEN